MNILLTGYPGFLSSAIFEYHQEKHDRIDTLGLLNAENRAGTHIVCNLAKEPPVLPDVRYDLVIHAAGKAHVVPRTPEEEQAFFDVNVKGTANLLQSLSLQPPRAIVFISSVAVYGAEQGERLTEDTALAATDPYGKSKIKAEQLIQNSFPGADTVRGIVRLPLIAGANAPGNLGSMFRAMRKGYYFNIGAGEAKRSVILRSDIPRALSLLATHGGCYNITDGNDLSFSAFYDGVRALIHCPKRPGLPKWAAFPMACAGEAAQRLLHRTLPFNLRRYRQMTESLTFSGERAIAELGFQPSVVLNHLDECCK